MIGSKGNYYYPGRNYWYTCVAKDAENLIVVKVSVLAFRIMSLSCKYCFNLSLHDLPTSIQNSITPFTTMTQALDHLKKSGYTPKLDKTKRKVFFKQNTFGSSLFNNITIRVIWDLGEVFAFLPRGRSSLDSVMAKASITGLSLPRIASKSPSLAEESPPQGNLIECLESAIEEYVDLSSLEADSALELIPTSKAPDDLPPPFPFPIESLKKILTFLHDVNIDKFITELGERVANGEESPVSPLLIKFGYNTTIDLRAFLSANFTESTWKNLFGVAYSKVGFFDGINLWRGNFHKGGEVGQVILAKDDLMNYLAKFSPLPEQTLNIKDLLYAILRDKNLNDYLKDDAVIKQLSKLIVSLNIPKFDALNAEKTIRIFVKLQEMAPSIITKHSLNNWDGIYCYLSKYILKGLEGKEYSSKDVLEAIHLIDDLKCILDVFLFPSPLPLQLLLSSRNKIEISCSEANNKKFFDCKNLFENFKDDKSLGVFMPVLVTAKIQTIINERNLSDYSFIDFRENINCYEESKSNLFVSFDNCLFDGFSFKNTHFINFHFKNVYFKKCDFTNISFSRNIIFENVHFDTESLDKFIAGLDESFNQPYYQLNITGINTIIMLGDGKLNTKLSKKFADFIGKNNPAESPSTEEAKPSSTQEQDPSTLQNQEVPGWSPNVSSFLDSVYNPYNTIINIGSTAYGVASGVASAASNTILHPVETAKTVGGIGINVVSGIASNASNTLLHPVETATNIKEKVQNLLSYYGSINIGSNNHADRIQCKAIQPELQNLKDQFKKEIKRLRKDLKLIIDCDSVEHHEMREKIYQHEDELRRLNIFMADLETKNLETKEIHNQQTVLLKGPLKHYYQSLLTGLSTVLNSIMLLNNDYANLIQSVPRKATDLSNKVSKNKVNTQESTIKRLERKLRNGLDYILEPSEILIPFLATLPDLPGIAGPINTLIKMNDQGKLKKTEKIFRGLTPKKLEKLSDEMARMISFCYEEQILLLSEEGIKRFAESAVECIAAALLNGFIPEDEDLIVYAFKSLRQLKQNHNKNVLNIKIPFTNEYLKGAKPKTSYKADDLYRNSGIHYLEDGKWFLHNQRGLNPQEFGYIRIKDERLKKHFITSNNPSATIAESLPVNLETRKISPLGANNQDHITLLLQEALSQVKEQAAALKIKQAEMEELQKDISRRSIQLEKSIAAIEELKQKKLNQENITSKDIRFPEQYSEEVTFKLAQTPSTVSLICPPGFISLGQSCYMSAALQVIRKIPRICERIQEITSSNEAEHKNNAIAHAISEVFKDGKEKNLENLRNAIFELSVFKGSGFTNYKVESKRIHERNEIKTPYIEPTYDYYKLSQIDVQEVLGEIFDQLKLIPYEVEECASASGVTERIEKNAENICRVPIPETIPFLKYLKIKYATDEKLDAFLKDKYKTNEDYEQYLKNKNNPRNIPPIPMTFQDILDVHFSEEEMDGPRVFGDILVNKWTKSSKIVDHPDYIMFQIVRFDNNADKIQTSLDFLDSKAMIECSTGKKEYEIVAYINHNGVDLYSGHYVSFVKNETDKDWYFYDDDNIQKRSPNEVFNYNDKIHNTNKDGYLVILKKAN